MVFHGAQEGRGENNGKLTTRSGEDVRKGLHRHNNPLIIGDQEVIADGDDQGEDCIVEATGIWVSDLGQK